MTEKITGKKRKRERVIAECIDFSLPCPSIFLTRKQARKWKCKRPLAKTTLRRVAKGIDMHVLKTAKPFLVCLTHQGGDRIEPIDEPARTITGANRGEKAVICPQVVRTDMHKSNATCAFSAEEPIRTVTSSGGFGVSETVLAPLITEHANSNKNSPYWSAAQPLRTQCAEVKGGHFALISGTVVGAGGPAYSGEPKPLDKPMNTQTTKNSAAIAATSMVKLRGTNIGDMVDRPVHTISAGGTHHGLVATYLAQHNGGFNTTPGHPADKPVSTISSKGSQQNVATAFLAAYYGNDAEPGQELSEPARTITAKARLGYVECPGAYNLTPEQITGARRVAAFLRRHGVDFEGEFAMVEGYVIVDIGLRMLTPRELFRAQGFPDSYVIDHAWVVDPKTGEVVEVRLTKEQQIRMCGNSVCPQVMAALIRANVPELVLRYGDERKEMVAA